VSQLPSAKLWNEPRSLSMDEWVKKRWYIYAMEYYSVIKKSKIISFAGKRMEWEIVLSKISQTQKDKYNVFSHMWNKDFFFLKE
jgi:hypothetical protein